MQKIDSLTPQQEQQMIDFREEYRLIGTSCEPMNRELARYSITQMYKLIDKKPPTFLFCQSPWQAVMEINILGDNLEANLWANLRDNLRDNLWANLRANLWDNLGDNLRANLWANLGANLGDNLWANLRANLRANYIYMQFWGQLDSYWISYYLFPHKFIRAMHTQDQFDLLMLWDNLAKSCGWWYVYENICFICDRFLTLYQDSRNRLHNPSGAAMSFRDGYSIYAVNGVRVPAWIIEEPQNITTQKITDEKNAEIRRVMMGIYGWDRMLNELNAKLIDEHSDPTIGQLWRWTEPDGIDVQIIYVRNGTQKPDGTFEHYSLRVPLEFNNVVEAHRWTYPHLRDMPLNDYIQMNQIRT